MTKEIAIMNAHIRLLAISLILALVLPGVSYGGKVQVDSGQTVKLHVAPGHAVTSDLAMVGDTVPLVLAEQVKIGLTIVFDANTTGKAVVTSVGMRGKAGKAGSITLRVIELGAASPYRPNPPGSIKLEGSAARQGQGRKFLSLLAGFGLFVRGGPGEFGPSDTISARTVGDVILEN
jgi:hypothetical protein